MADDRKRARASEAMREAYRKIRRRVPPPGEVLPDRRRKRERDRARREIQREIDER